MGSPAPNFDPYHKWLGISPKDRPAHHYRLLGVDLFEADADVIDTAANQRMAYLHSCATGEYVEQAEQLLEEIAAARLCLLNSAKKQEYDRKLRGELSRQLAQRFPAPSGSGGRKVASAVTTNGPAPVLPATEVAPTPAEVVHPVAFEGSQPSVARNLMARRRVDQRRSLLVAVFCLVVGVGGVGLGYAVLSLSSGDNRFASNTAPTDAGVAQSKQGTATRPTTRRNDAGPTTRDPLTPAKRGSADRPAPPVAPKIDDPKMSDEASAARDPDKQSATQGGDDSDDERPEKSDADLALVLAQQLSALPAAIDLSPIAAGAESAATDFGELAIPPGANLLVSLLTPWEGTNAKVDYTIEADPDASSGTGHWQVVAVPRADKKSSNEGDDEQGAAETSPAAAPAPEVGTDPDGRIVACDIWVRDGRLSAQWHEGLSESIADGLRCCVLRMAAGNVSHDVRLRSVQVASPAQIDLRQKYTTVELPASATKPGSDALKLELANIEGLAAPVTYLPAERRVGHRQPLRVVVLEAEEGLDKAEMPGIEVQAQLVTVQGATQLRFTPQLCDTKGKTSPLRLDDLKKRIAKIEEDKSATDTQLGKLRSTVAAIEAEIARLQNVIPLSATLQSRKEGEMAKLQAQKTAAEVDTKQLERKSTQLDAQHMDWTRLGELARSFSRDARLHYRVFVDCQGVEVDILASDPASDAAATPAAALGKVPSRF